MQEKIKTHLQKYGSYIFQLRDIRAFGLVVFGVIVLLMSWSGVKVIETNYGLQKQIAELRQEVAVQKLENSNTKLQNQYFKTDAYQELQARRSFGLAKAGETLLIVPKNVATAQLVESKLPKIDEKTGNAADDAPWYARNWQAWMDFFLHRQ